MSHRKKLTPESTHPSHHKSGLFSGSTHLAPPPRDIQGISPKHQHDEKLETMTAHLEMKEKHYLSLPPNRAIPDPALDPEGFKIFLRELKANEPDPAKDPVGHKRYLDDLDRVFKTAPDDKTHPGASQSFWDHVKIELVGARGKTVLNEGIAAPFIPRNPDQTHEQIMAAGTTVPEKVLIPKGTKIVKLSDFNTPPPRLSQWWFTERDFETIAQTVEAKTLERAGVEDMLKEALRHQVVIEDRKADGFARETGRSHLEVKDAVRDFAAISKDWNALKYAVTFELTEDVYAFRSYISSQPELSAKDQRPRDPSEPLTGHDLTGGFRQHYIPNMELGKHAKFVGAEPIEHLQDRIVEINTPAKQQEILDSIIMRR